MTIYALFASRVRWSMRDDLRELLVREPKLIAFHLCFLSEAVNHKPLFTPALLSDISEIAVHSSQNLIRLTDFGKPRAPTHHPTL